MNDQNPASTPIDPTPIKRSIKNPLKRAPKPTDESDTTNSLKEKARTGLAVVGGTALVGGALIYIAKKRGVEGVAVDLPTVDVNPDAS